MLSELFVYEEDFWSNSLRAFGYELGRFIYLMDAAMDYKKDMKTGNYNPLFEMKKKPEEMEPILGLPLGNAMEVFEKLPLVQDEHLLRNILYGGVWQQYYAKIRGKMCIRDRGERRITSHSQAFFKGMVVKMCIRDRFPSERYEDIFPAFPAEWYRPESLPRSP